MHEYNVNVINHSVIRVAFEACRAIKKKAMHLHGLLIAALEFISHGFQVIRPVRMQHFADRARMPYEKKHVLVDAHTAGNQP